MRLLGNLSYWRNVSPTGAAQDFVAVWRENPHRWRVLAVSIALTAGVFYVFLPPSQRAEPAKPTISFITTFAPDRSEAEIVATNVEAQKRKEKLAAIEAERVELRKQLYRELGRATFIDVDAMERQIKADEAAEARAKARQQQQQQQQASPGGTVAAGN